jgi:hypothetical protein
MSPPVTFVACTSLSWLMVLPFQKTTDRVGPELLGSECAD